MTAAPFQLNPGFLPADKLEFSIGMKVRGSLKDFVYQGTSAPFANASTLHDPRRQKRRLVIPADPKTPTQIIQRSKMSLAVTAWQALTPAEKLAYNNIRGKRAHTPRDGGRRVYFSGYTLFLSLHMNGKI